jgi:periplasmic protein CpxP/Spy
MVKKILMIFMGIIAVGGIFLAAGCGRRCATPEKRAEWIVDKIESKLDLSKEQVTEVNKIKDEILAKRDEFKGLHEGLYETMLKEIRSDKIDANSINQLFTAKETKFKELRSFMIAEAAKFHAILTPEQREKLAKEMEKHHKDRCNK